MSGYHPESAEYVPFGEIPGDAYEVESIVRDGDGTTLLLRGERHLLRIVFGFTESLCICDEGRRIESYHRVPLIRDYGRRDFFGVPLFHVSRDSDFLEWLKFESCCFSCWDEHYAVVTRNEFIDIASVFPPKIEVEELGAPGQK